MVPNRVLVFVVGSMRKRPLDPFQYEAMLERFGEGWSLLTDLARALDGFFN